MPPPKHTQEDNFLPTMTVQETLTFYATLQLPDSNSKAQRLERVAEVLAAMGLSHTVHTLVGAWAWLCFGSVKGEGGVRG
jgi:ABC-type multidrug transport system ATPase subunit